MRDPEASGLLAWIILAGAAAGAGYAIWRYVIRPIARAVTLIVQIGGDFLGHDERPGVARVPGVMERLASIDTQIRVNGTGLPIGDAMARALVDIGELKSTADDLKGRADTNAAGIAEAKDAAQQAAEKAEEAHEEMHGWIAEGQLREETYRETLREVHGIDLDPPPRRDPHARTREDDA